MGRTVVPMTGQEATRLPEPCRRCLLWEEGASPPEPRTSSRFAALRGGAHGAPDPADRKRAWISTQVQDGGPPGCLVVVDAEVAGYASYGPAEVFASRGPMTPMVSDDALLLATLWVSRVHREAGLGRLLLQAALREAIRLDRPALEAYGDRRWEERACLVPDTWLLHQGFEVHREHLRTPLFRLETRRLARWATSLEHALDEVLARLPRPVRNERVPQGAPIPNARAVDTAKDPG